MMQCYMSVIHSSKDYLESTVCPPCAGGTCPPAHLIMAITGFIHTVPAAAGFLFKQGVHERDSCCSQKSSCCLHLCTWTAWAKVTSNFPVLQSAGNFLFYSAENLIWLVKDLHIGRALALLSAYPWRPYYLTCALLSPGVECLSRSFAQAVSPTTLPFSFLC